MYKILRGLIMEKTILSEEKIKKFDDVHIKSMNLSGIVYAIKGSDVVVNTLKKGLVKAKMDDLKKLYTDNVNEGVSVFDERHFGKKGIIIMIDDNGKKVSAIFKDKKNADKYNRNKQSDIEALLKIAKTKPFGKAIDESVSEGAMSDIDIIAQEAKDFKDFVKEFYKEYKDFSKTKESLKWLEDIYKGRTKMEGLERVASALPQTEEEPVNEEKVYIDFLNKKKGFKQDRIKFNSYEDAVKWARKNFDKFSPDMIKYESVNEHKDCGCGCGGVTEGGCGTSLTEVQLNEWRAEEVLQQLGGRKFIAMTGAKNFVKNDKNKSITFKVPKAKSGINHIRITLTSMDVYNIDFISVRGTNIKTVATAKGVYNDQLQSVFTQYTGLYTSL